MTKTRILALLLVLVMTLSFALTSCKKPPVNDGGSTETKTELRMATGYNNLNTGLAFDAETIEKNDKKDGVEDGAITLADGKTYRAGDLKPTWVEVENILGISIINKFTGAGSAEKEFNVWKEKLNEVDMVAGSASVLSEAGTAGNLINLADHLDKMPNFKAYLDSNPIVLLSITSPDAEGNLGAIYFSPYFDGVNDIERMPLMRTDWVVKLLDGEGDFTAEASKNLADASYTPYMPTSGKVEIDVVKLDASGTEKVTKNYDAAGNIIANMNAELAAGTVSGVEAVNMLRDYIDTAYNGYYGTTRSNLFVGQNAAWDADELVALLRCVVANPKTLNGTDTIQGLFSREDNNNQRRVDMFRFAGTLFGVRGLESRQDFLYVGTDGKLHDARQEADTYEALERMNALVDEGLIAESFVNAEEVKTETMLKNDTGFMHYDYNQTQTVYNQTALQDGEKYMAVMVPVAHWFDGTEGGVYMRFTESWRSVKTDGWAISKAGVADDAKKLEAALALIDYAYSAKGQILMSYGPDAFIDTTKTFDFNGKQMPVISQATFDELWAKAGGNYTNYARQFLGSTLSFVKSQAFEFQCTHEVGKEGAGKISNAIKYGTIKHPELAVTENPWYSIVPTTLPTSREANDAISALTELGSKGKFNQSKGGENILVDIITDGYVDLGVDTAEALIAKISAPKDNTNNGWGGATYLLYKQEAYELLLDYYKSIK